MNEKALDFYRRPGAMTALPEELGSSVRSVSRDSLREVVHGLLLHRDWAPAYGVEGNKIRLDEQNLRSTNEILGRAIELSKAPLTTQRQPIDRVLCICRHFSLLHVALLRDRGIPARLRCGFSNYFDPAKWYDHWITEWWDGDRWVREDPQIDALQAEIVKIDFDPYDQPAGKFLTGGEAWLAARAGDVDPVVFGIFDMWGIGFIAGNVISDLACMNSVELLPWDSWGIMPGPGDEIHGELETVLNEVAELTTTEDFDAMRSRFESDDRLRVPADIISFIDNEPVAVHLDL